VRVDGIEVIVEGAGPKAIVMIHGWPDTHRLWDAQVEALKERYRCVRFTLPGFDLSGPKRAYPLDELLEMIRRVVEQACPGERVTLLLHDWGCFFGYQFAMRYPELVERVIGVDIGDAGSRHNRAELGLRGMLMVLGYQVWLALAWRIGGGIGDAMARWMARAIRCPTDARTIGSQMGYPYAMRWLGAAGGLDRLKAFQPHVPMLFVYGERKPFMFHSHAWAERLAARPQSRVMAFASGHWIMIERPREFDDALLAWLGETERQA
jgi:pimeloyl-ACP methyl ester carboxylesterase